MQLSPIHVAFKIEALSQVAGHPPSEMKMQFCPRINPEDYNIEADCC